MLVDRRGKQSERQQLCAHMADGAVMEWGIYSDVMMTAKNKPSQFWGGSGSVKISCARVLVMNVVDHGPLALLPEDILHKKDPGRLKQLLRIPFDCFIDLLIVLVATIHV